MRAFVFPGQGSQQVGMGRQLAETFASAREVFDEVDEALQEPLSRLMFEGPLETLTLTENAQPALMAASLAAARVLAREFGFPVHTTAAYVAGHSLGEYSALAAAGAMSVANAARLLRTRGRAMQMAVPVGQGAMAALLGLDLDAARAAASQAAAGEVCDIANDNGPGQVVVSGHKAAVERAVELAKAAGAKRAILLPVSAPFHCSLMAPVGEIMGMALRATPLATPSVPLVSNVTAGPVVEPAAIAQGLVAQVVQTVRWRECVTFMAGDGVEAFYELGAGKVLTGLNKRVAPGALALSGGTPQELEAMARSIDGMAPAA